jgi:hypothetical protein
MRGIDSNTIEREGMEGNMGEGRRRRGRLGQ